MKLCLLVHGLMFLYINKCQHIYITNESIFWMLIKRELMISIYNLICIFQVLVISTISSLGINYFGHMILQREGSNRLQGDR
jgi:hypothetical protein